MSRRGPGPPGGFSFAPYLAMTLPRLCAAAEPMLPTAKRSQPDSGTPQDSTTNSLYSGPDENGGFPKPVPGSNRSRTATQQVPPDLQQKGPLAQGGSDVGREVRQDGTNARL